MAVTTNKQKKYGYLVRLNGRVHVGLTTTPPNLFKGALSDYGLDGGEVLACGEPKQGLDGWKCTLKLGDLVLGGYGESARVYGAVRVQVPATVYTVCLDGALDSHHELMNPHVLKQWFQYAGILK